MTKKKKKLPTKKPQVHALLFRPADSVMKDEPEDVEGEPDTYRGNSLSRQDEEPEERSLTTTTTPPAVHKAARDLILQAKSALHKHGGHFPAQATLILESDVELDAAIMLEHQGRGRLFKVTEDGEECYAFEFNEEGAVGGILKGDVLMSKD